MMYMNFLFLMIAQLAGAVEYTDCFSAVPPTSVLDMTLNNQLVRSGMWSTPSLSSLPGPLWPGVIVPDSLVLFGP